jgi:hypothetical protein
VSEYVTLEEFVAVDEPGAEPLAASGDGGSVIPANGLIVFYGNGGAGKTTALIDAAMHLAAGAEWLGLVKPARPLTIVWIENEGPRPEFRKKLKRKLDAWGGSAVTSRIYLHEDPWEQFSFRDEQCRATLVQRIRDLTDGTESVDLVIAGPVKAIGMKGAGTDDDIADFLRCVNAVRRETGVTVVLVHHENRAGQISGAWESRPDTLVHVQAQGHGRTRLFWQKCRWSSELHGTSTNLLWAPGESFVREEREEVTDDTIAALILEAALANGGASWNTVDEAVTGKGDRKRAIRDRLLAAGQLIDTGSGSRMRIWHADDPARPGRDAVGTQLVVVR